jgi:hypothetical protein
VGGFLTQAETTRMAHIKTKNLNAGNFAKNRKIFRHAGEIR